MLPFEGGSVMGDQSLEIFFRFSGIVAVLSAVTLFFVSPGTAEFVVTVIALVLSAAVAVICGILLNKGHSGRKKDEK